jgi:DNA repair exonuclease SbcCD ATPase subunit/DNA repair exonuclease SbcCD nuclease subunit
MSKLRFLQIGDIHIRSSRREEQMQVRDSLYTDMKTLISQNPTDQFIIIVTGDVFDTKSKSTATEQCDVQDLFYELDAIAPTVVIPGNHDLVINKPGGPCLIDPVIRDSNRLKRLYYFRESGYYKIPNFDKINFVISVPDGDIITRENPIIRNPGELYVGIMHEEISGCSMFGYKGSGIRFDGSVVTTADFTGMDLCLLGHIHQRQLLTNCSAYNGSLIQQNFGEPHNTGHGYIDWTASYPINSEMAVVSPIAHDIYNSHGFITFVFKNDVDLTEMPLPSHPNAIRVEYNNCGEEFIRLAVECLEKKYGKIKNIRCMDVLEILPKPTSLNINSEDKNTIIKIGEQIASQEYQELLIRKLLAGNKLTEEIIKMHNFKACAFLDNDASKVAGRRSRWKLKKLKFSNMFCYGPNNEVTFDYLSGAVSGIIAPNKSGKSAFIDILIYVLYNEVVRGDKRNILNHTYRDNGGSPAHGFNVAVEFESDGKIGKIIKSVEGSGAPKVKFIFDGVDLTTSSIVETYKIIFGYIGTYKDAINTAIALQDGPDDFVHMSSDLRKVMLARLFNLNIFTDLLKDAKEEKIRLKNEYSAKDKSINMVRGGMSAEQLNEVIKKREALENDLIPTMRSNISEMEIELNKIYDVWRDKTPVKVTELIEKMTEEELYELSVPMAVQNVVEKPNEPMPDVSNTFDASGTLNMELLNRLRMFNLPNNHNQITDIPTKEFFNFDPNITYYKEISTNLEFNSARFNELKAKLTTLPDISNHQSMIQSAAQLKDNEYFPENIRRHIKDYMETYKLYSAAVNEVELAKNLNVDSLNLSNNCIGCNNVRRITQLATQKIALIKNYIDSNNARLAQINEYKGFLEKQLNEVAEFNNLNKIYMANLLVNYQRNLLNNLAAIELAEKWSKYNDYIENNSIECVQRRNYLQYKASARRQILEFNINKLRAEYSALERSYGECKSSEILISERLNQVTIMKAELNDLKKQETLYELYQTVLDEKKGIPALLLKQNISAFISAVNQILAEFTDMQIEISEELYLGVRIGSFHHAEPIEMGSGYQKFVIALSCRVALADISNTSLIDGIIIDEGFACMDNTNQEATIDFIRELSKERELLFIISHIESLQGAIDRSLTIERKPSPSGADYSYIRNTPNEVKRTDRPLEFVASPDDPRQYYCNYCKRTLSSNALAKHKVCRQHMRNIETWE